MLLGLGTGAFGVVVGTGGGLILVPMLLLFFDMEPAVVAGTSLTLVAVSSISGAAGYRRLGLVDRRSGLLLGIAAVPGSVLAPFVVEFVAGDAFRVMFGLLLVSLAVYTILPSRVVVDATMKPGHLLSAAVRRRHIISRSGQVFDYEFNEALAAVFNGFVGFISAFFGTGGGFLRTPVLVSVFGFPVRVAVATSIFALSLYATTGALVHALLGHVDWYPTLVWAGLGLVAGSQIGAMLSARVRGRWILRLLVALLFVMGSRLLMQGVLG
jgi:uncharacterized membrane protein YfcA